jgi:hypothetical protein
MKVQEVTIAFEVFPSVAAHYPKLEKADFGCPLAVLFSGWVAIFIVRLTALPSCNIHSFFLRNTLDSVS